MYVFPYVRKLIIHFIFKYLFLLLYILVNFYKDKKYVGNVTVVSAGSGIAAPSYNSDLILCSLRTGKGMNKFIFLRYRYGLNNRKDWAHQS